MLRKIRTFRILAVTLFVRFATMLAAAALAATVLFCLMHLDSFLLYRTAWEIVSTFTGLPLLGVLAGVMAGAVLALVVSVAMAVPGRIRHLSRRVRRITYIFVRLLTLLFGAYCLKFLSDWVEIVSGWHFDGAVKILLLLGFLVSGLAVLFLRRNKPSTAFQGFFYSDAARRNVLVFGGAAAAVSAVNLALRATPARQQGPTADGAPDILLITFDALAAEDMPVYGYALPTTPNIAQFARAATVFDHFYSCATFTTPSVVAFSCGRYPSNTGVYHLCGRLHGAAASRTLPNVLHASGYRTGASVANLAAHPDTCHIEGYDLRPSSPIHDAAVYVVQTDIVDAYANIDYSIAVGNNIQKILGNVDKIRTEMTGPRPLAPSNAPPEMSFAQAEVVWNGMSSPKFLHVHVLAPHAPYLPAPAYCGRFLPPDQLTLYSNHPETLGNICPDLHYAPQHQAVFDALRLRYNEWISHADAAFGAFITRLERKGALANTVIALSADHGESFQGGFYSHGLGFQHRSVVHVPLIIRRPGQTQAARVAVACDAAALAPTLLDLAGIPVPEWMDGRSLKAELDAPGSATGGYAFTQYLEHNSVFGPITNGTVGVVDGRHQYIVDIGTGKGDLYELANAHLHTQEISARRPDIARTLRERIRARFSSLSIPA